MDDLDLDTQSVFSLDSLEDETSQYCSTVKDVKNTTKATTRSQRTNDSQRKDEVLIQNANVNPVRGIRNLNDTADSERKARTTGVGLDLSPFDDAYKTFSFVGGTQRCRSARIANTKRISRSRIPIAVNAGLPKPRNRSVSYLDQFKKRVYGLHQVDSSIYSTVESKTADLNDISFNGSVRSGSRTHASGLELREKLISTPKIKTMTMDAQTFPTDCTSVPQSKEVKNAKSKKRTDVILSRSDAAKPLCDEELDWKMSFLNWEDWAKRVAHKDFTNFNLRTFFLESSKYEKIDWDEVMKNSVDTEKLPSKDEKIDWDKVLQNCVDTEKLSSKDEKFVWDKGLQNCIDKEKVASKDFKIGFKNLLQKREDYASRVRLWNKEKFDRQKERERLYKFKDPGRKQKIDTKNSVPCAGERLPDQAVRQDILPPLTSHMIESVLNPKATKTSIKKQRSKANKTEEQKKSNTTKDASNLTALQQRHSHEKQLVDSLRNLILKT